MSSSTIVSAISEKNVTVGVMHMHRSVAKKENGFKHAHNIWWPFLADKLRTNNVQFLCGDANMSMFKVVPELRSRGVYCNLVSWYPWLQEGSATPMVDSCGIWALCPCDVKTWHTCDVYATNAAKLDFHGKQGPGFPFKSYLPVTDPMAEMLENNLTLEADTQAEVAARNQLPGEKKRIRLVVQEKLFQMQSSIVVITMEPTSHWFCRRRM